MLGSNPNIGRKHKTLGLGSIKKNLSLNSIVFHTTLMEVGFLISPTFQVSRDSKTKFTSLARLDKKFIQDLDYYIFYDLLLQ